jgi:hypothetical protein
MYCIQQWRSKLSIKLDNFQADLREVICTQHKIRWLDLLESLPAKGWKVLQHGYYREEHIKKSSQKWIQGLLIQPHHMGHRQWKHRCDVKANITKPQEKASIVLLHNIIEEQFLLGTQDLQRGDKGLLNCNILQLLQRPLVYKRGWTTRILAPRQRAHRIAQQDEKLDSHSKEAQALLQWMCTHKEQYKVTGTRKHNREQHEKPNQGEAVDDEYLRELVLEEALYAKQIHTSTESCTHGTPLGSHTKRNTGGLLQA